MRYKGKMTLAMFVAALVVSAVSTASALAATPEFVRESGKLIGTKFTAKSHATRFKIVSPAITWECAHSTAAGEISGTKTVSKLVIKYTECKEGSIAFRSEEDKTTKEGVKGAPEEIVLDPLKGTLTGTEESSELKLEPEAGPEKEFTYVKGLPVEGPIRGTVVGRMASPDFAETGSLTFSDASGLTCAGDPMTLTGTQEIKYESGAKIKVT
jgi:hypothetical protein